MRIRHRGSGRMVTKTGGVEEVREEGAEGNGVHLRVDMTTATAEEVSGGGEDSSSRTRMR